MNWLGKLRTVAPVIGGYAASILAAWAAKKGFAISDTEATAIVAGGGHVLSKIIAGAGVNPNDAAAPSLVRNAPVPNVYVPVEVAPNDVSPYTPPEPTLAPSPSLYVPDAVCQFCTGEHGAHYEWCSAVGGTGIAPAGFFDDTRKINHDWLRKVAKSAAAAVTVEEPPAEKSRVLLPKPEPEPAPAPVTKKRVARAATVVKVARRKTATANPNSERGDDD